LPREGIKQMEKQDILLETGTNEVEVAEFMLCNQNFGVNVAKIREFIPFEGITVSKLPGRHPSVAGVFILRGKSIPLVNLDQHLELNCEEKGDNQVVVVTEFNNMTTAFVADFINRIHRVSWSMFKPLNAMLAANATCVVGSVNIEDHEVLILDLENIIGEIFPESIINYDEEAFAEKPKVGNREQAKIFFAEDSAIIRTQVAKILNSVGYEQLTVFENGQLAYDAILALKRQADAEGTDIREHIDLLLTDIEMPQMDGLALCRHVKEDMALKIPVLIFSSLINEQMAIKCDRVGAAAYMAKPETERLIELLDEHALADK
jgi:two-component system chemotaxis response regulator CheV